MIIPTKTFWNSTPRTRLDGQRFFELRSTMGNANQCRNSRTKYVNADVMKTFT